MELVILIGILIEAFLMNKGRKYVLDKVSRLEQLEDITIKYLDTIDCLKVKVRDLERERINESELVKGVSHE